MTGLAPRPRSRLGPGALHLPDLLPSALQRRLATAADAWARGPVPPHRPLVRGHPMSVDMVCLGRHWRPGGYTLRAVDVNGAAVLPLPDWLADIGRQALAAAGWAPAQVTAYRPDVALVNHYREGASMGLHRDADEPGEAPVVSLSVGDAADFRFGHPDARRGPYVDVRLESGDVVVFGGASRRAYHAVRRIHPGTAPPHCGLPAGRLNITLRMTGIAP